MSDKVYVCEKGHRFGSKTSIIVEDGVSFFEAMPYAGEYCTVCYMAFVAAHISRVREETTEEQPHA